VDGADIRIAASHLSLCLRTRCGTTPGRRRSSMSLLTAVFDGFCFPPQH